MRRAALLGAAVQAATFVPTSITGLQLWLDASDASTLWTDTAGTTHATAADAVVARWDDKSGNARNATNGTAGQQPLLKLATQNGKNALYFDGAGGAADFLTTGLNPSTTISTGFTILTAMKLDDVASRTWGWAYGNTSGSGGDLFFGKTGGSDLVHYSVQTWHGGTSATGSAHAGAWHQWSHEEAVGTQRVYQNGTARVNTTNGAGSVTATNFHVGHTPSRDQGWKGPIGEVLVWNTVLSTTDRQSAESYLKTKWGTP